jgi:hypothetical protein
MHGRIILVAGAACALAMVGTASAANGSFARVKAQATQAGVTYGAVDGQGGHVWFKLRKNRKAFASHEVEWYADCSDGDTFFGETSLGSEHGKAMPIRKGRFSASVVNDVYDGSATVTYRVSGRVTAAAIKGQFTVNITGSLDGSDFTCKAGPIRFNAVN